MMLLALSPKIRKQSAAAWLAVGLCNAIQSDRAYLIG
jgi:hypothetical protein